jgi:hypothetical protein
MRRRSCGRRIGTARDGNGAHSRKRASAARHPRPRIARCFDHYACFLGGSPRINSTILLADRIPWSQGKMQGISLIPPLFAKISKTSANSAVCAGIPYAIRDVAGNYFARAGNPFGPLAGAGNVAQNRSAESASPSWRRHAHSRQGNAEGRRQSGRAQSDEALRAAGGGRQGLPFEATYTIGAELAGDRDASQL